ncbi:MAG: hypothetical protein Kow0029_07590 [Candidatus Rifleibacteriota bacterium]
MTKDNIAEKLEVFLSYSAFFALFIFLPILIAGLLGIHAIAFEQQRAFVNSEESIETKLTQLACDVDNDVFLTRVSRSVHQYLRTKKLGNSGTQAFIKKLQNFLPIDFDLYLFDKKGLLVTPEKIRLRSRYVATRLWSLIKASPIEQSNLFKKIKKPIKSFLGDEFKLAQLLDKRDALSSIIVRHQQGSIYWCDDSSDSYSGIIIIYWQHPDLAFRIKETLKRKHPDFARGFVYFSSDRYLQLAGKKLDKDRVDSIYARLALMNQKSWLHGNELWVGRNVGNSFVFIADIFDGKYYDDLRTWLILILLLVMAGLAFFMIRVSRSGSLKLSIRLKLTGLFLTAVLVPIMGFMFIGRQYLHDREETLLVSVSNQSRNILFSLDESFKNVGESYLNELDELIPALVEDNRAKINQELQKRLETNELVTVELRDTTNGEVIYSVINELFFEGMKEVSDAFSRFCIDTALGTNLSDSVDPIVSMIVRAPEGGMFFLLDRPGEIHPLRFGPAPLLIFWKLVERANSDKLYLLVVQSASVILKKLVRQTFRDLFIKKSYSPYLVVARHNTSGRWFPAKLVHNMDLKKFSERLVFSDKPLDTEIELNGERYVLTGQKGKYTSDYCFFSFYPKKLIDKDLQKIQRLILFGMIVFIFIALVSGNILSSTFLEPVFRLTLGVEAIKKRDGNYRIETDQHDEFGDLSISFNHMIEDLKEMQLARDVQESLLPSNFPDIDGYQISFINRMASDVGGDYFDLHKLDNDKVCILIGDVTGHGVSSALVMAMAKAIVYQGLKEKRSLVELFEDLNLAVYTYFKIPPARKMITLFAAILDIKSGNLSCTNAGHNFPVKVSENGKIEDIGIAHLPIGASKKLRKLSMKDYQINKGEAVVFYTDGLIEVKNHQDSLYGYERFKEHLASLGGKTSQEILDALVAAYDRYLGDAEPDDDLTVIVIKRV